MLEQARARLGDRVRYVAGDMTEPLPAGPWDAVVSALATHHLPDADKETLFARVREALSPGGVFINAEQVAAPAPDLEAHYEHHHEHTARARGSDNEEWAGAVERMRHDRRASVERHFEWLREAGFADADCLYKDHGFAVLVARR